MRDSQKFKFYSFNLNGGEDTRIPARVYAETFGWEIKEETIGHSEVCIPEEIILVFSRPTANCPVETGTLTLVTDDIPMDLGTHFTLDPRTESNPKYLSYLDSWGNRLWFYQKKI